MNGMDAGIRAALTAARASARDTIRDWRRGDAHRALEATFADCGPDDAEEALNRATRLFGDSGWAEALLEPLVEALGAAPCSSRPSRPVATASASVRCCPRLPGGSDLRLRHRRRGDAAGRRRPPASSPAALP